MSAGMDKVTAPDGCVLAAVASGEGTGLPILFSNSLGADHSMWNGVVEGMTGRRLIRYDSRGHGRSQAPAGPYTQEMLGRDALAVLDHYGIERAVVCGLSLGGLVTGWLAAHAPERVAGIVLANTACAFKPDTMWRDRAAQARAGGMAQFAAPTLERWFTADFRAARPEVMAAVSEMVAANSAEGYAASCEALAVADMSGDLRAARCPALVIAGDADPSTTVAHAQAIVEQLGDARLVCLAAAHLSAIEVPDAFREAVEAFVGQVEA